MGLGMKRMEMVFIEESDVRYGFGVEDLGVVNLKFKLFWLADGIGIREIIDWNDKHA